MSTFREYSLDPSTFWVTQDNPNLNLYNHYNHLIEQAMSLALQGKTSEFFSGADIYMTRTPNNELLHAFGKVGYQKVEAILQQAGAKKAEEMMDVLSLNYYALFALTEDVIVVGVDTSVQTEKKWNPTALYTRSKQVLETLDKNGQLQDMDWDKINKNLTQGKTLTGIKDGLLPVIRLDPVSSLNGVPIYKAMVPQKNLDAGASHPVAIIPLFAYVTFVTLLKKFAKQTAFRFEATSIIGTKGYNVTLSPDVQAQVYQQSGFSLDDIKRRINKQIVGFDVTSQRIYAYDLESSFHEHGVVSFRPEMLDNIHPLKPTDLNTTRHKVNYPTLRLVYGTKIRALKAGDLKTVTFLDLQTYPNLKDAQEGLLLFGENASNKDLHVIMQQNPHIFGDLEVEVANREKRTLKVLRDLEPVKLAKTDDARKLQIEDLLSRGVIRLTAKRKTSNTVLEVLATNNPNVLNQTLGKDYVQKFESGNNRLKAVKATLTQGYTGSRADLEKLVVSYNIGDYLNLQNFLNVDFSTGDFSNAITELDVAITEMSEKAKARKISPMAINYRNVNAEDPTRLYGSVESGNILAVEFREFK